ncbi:Transmembrane domain-containing protein [Orpheovirus IHUMI-LCC2]|uniref:Transmembrane domain-containing protein n=1 Tax=Orpheovirus IHUMI-LCC2 TaxID=2023057 RepID=A0A2I2L4S4_9VIRU|nr:Transmembrane domain-containing protein [Orpheovirus IHUMI-LCC2]SNW62538.1 Transmembrane domain-containing protein [Orpheovirus IHUMI-LCC2]
MIDSYITIYYDQCIGTHKLKLYHLIHVVLMIFLLNYIIFILYNVVGLLTKIHKPPIILIK